MYKNVIFGTIHEQNEKSLTNRNEYKKIKVHSLATLCDSSYKSELKNEIDTYKELKTLKHLNKMKEIHSIINRNYN